jgi:hypothetical protein
MRSRGFWVIVLALLGLASCHANRVAKPIAAGSKAGMDNSQYTIIGTMQNRDKVVTVKTGPKGVVYSVATKDGQSLYENISQEKLKAEVPALHDLLETGTAAGWAGMDWPRARTIENVIIDGRTIDARR